MSMLMLYVINGYSLIFYFIAHIILTNPYTDLPINLFICGYVCIVEHMVVCICMCRLCVCLCLCVCMCLCLCLCTCTCVSVHAWACLAMCGHVCLCANLVNERNIMYIATSFQVLLPYHQKTDMKVLQNIMKINHVLIISHNLLITMAEYIVKSQKHERFIMW